MPFENDGFWIIKCYLSYIFLCSFGNKTDGKGVVGILAGFTTIMIFRDILRKKSFSNAPTYGLDQIKI